MKKYAIYALALAAMTFTACSEDDDDNPVVVTPSTSAVVLNTGNWGGNDASIMRYDIVNHTITADLYAAANKEGLGDLAQDIIKYGSKYYVTVTGSSKLVVLDKNMKIVKTIPFMKGETPTQPRYMAGVNGKVYVTAYDGCITRAPWTLVENLINRGDATTLRNRQHGERMADDANRFRDLKTVEATLSLRPTDAKAISPCRYLLRGYQLCSRRGSVCRTVAEPRLRIQPSRPW